MFLFGNILFAQDDPIPRTIKVKRLGLRISHIEEFIYSKSDNSGNTNFINSLKIPSTVWDYDCRGNTGIVKNEKTGAISKEYYKNGVKQLEKYYSSDTNTIISEDIFYHNENGVLDSIISFDEIAKKPLRKDYYKFFHNGNLKDGVIIIFYNDSSVGKVERLYDSLGHLLNMKTIFFRKDGGVEKSNERNYSYKRNMKVRLCNGKKEVVTHLGRRERIVRFNNGRKEAKSIIIRNRQGDVIKQKDVGYGSKGYNKKKTMRIRRWKIYYCPK